MRDEISKRYNKVNNKYFNLITKSKNQNSICLDANNLYGYSMSKFLPTSGFKLIDPKDFEPHLFKKRVNTSLNKYFLLLLKLYLWL